MSAASLPLLLRAMRLPTIAREPDSDFVVVGSSVKG